MSSFANLFTGALVAAGLLLDPGVAVAGTGMDLVSHLPGSFNLVVGIDLGRARKSPLFKTWQKGLEQDAERGRAYAEFVRRLGFDPATDVESVVVGAQILQGAEQARFLTVAKGSFDAQKAYKALMQGPGDPAGKGKKSKLSAGSTAGPTEKRHNGVKYLVATDSGRPIAAAITPGLALVGAEEAVKQGIDLMKGKGGKSLHDNGRLMALAKRAATDGVAWVSVVLPDSLQADPNMGPAGALATARDVFGTVRIADGLDVMITSICPNEGVAAGLQQALMIGVAAAQRNPEVARTGAGKLLSKVKTEVSGKELVTSLKLDNAEFQELIDQIASKVSPGGAKARPEAARAKPEGIRPPPRKKK